jgi:hypothetical protein
MLIYINFPEGGLFETRNLEYIKIYSHDYVNKFNTTTINLFKEYSVAKKGCKNKPRNSTTPLFISYARYQTSFNFHRKHET